MLGIQYRKAPPTIYVIHFQNGRVIRAGQGLSFWYFAPTSSIVDVPVASVDIPFVFNEVTSDFQQITVQGQLTYRVSNPQELSLLLDFSVNHKGLYLAKDDPRILLAQRLVNLAQAEAKGIIQAMPLRSALTGGEAIVSGLTAALREADAIKMLGLSLLDLSIIRLAPTPETARALEAETREVIQQAADQATYARRNAAIEEERRIKESELATELAVEAKRKDIREAKMAADIAVEEQRTRLIDTQVENDRKEADSRGYALEKTLAPLQEFDWRKLLALSGSNDSRLAISLAFQELAQNAGKIGQLNLTPDLLQSLLNAPEKTNVRKDHPHNA